MGKISLFELLTYKTKEQINKELSRRGLTFNWYSREEAIQAIIEHDAYYEGVNDARQNTVKNGKPGISIPEMLKPTPSCCVPVPRTTYMITDYANPNEPPIFASFTAEQWNLIKWLSETCLISDDLSFTKMNGVRVEEP